ncbi:MAG: thiolase family protein [Anaerolineales bacterium]
MTLTPETTPVIVAVARTPVGKAKRGSLATARPEHLMALVIRDLLKRANDLDPALIDDFVLGCAFPEGQQGMNMARLVGLKSGLPESVPAETINRFCSSGLQSIAHVAHSIMAGQIQVALAGGVESMSLVPMTGFHFAPDPALAFESPEYFTNMGLTAENVADKYGITRQDQDEFALRSNQLAAHAVDTGIFDPELVPVPVEITELGPDGVAVTRKITLTRDEGPRADTTLAALGKLRPVFREGGSVTAGNASQMSDGAAGAIVMSLAKAQELGLKPLARFVAFAVGGVPPAYMGIGPVVAIPKALKVAGLSLNEIDLFEINEAFAAQSVAVVRELGIPLEKVNVNGGAIALGHPLGCSGAKLTTQLLYEMKRRGSRYGMVTMCIGGGMGAAGIFENLE